MDTNNKEEMIEELDDVETSAPLQNDEIMPDKKIEDEIKVDIIQDEILAAPEDSSVMEENDAKEKSIQTDNQVNEEEVAETKEEKEKQDVQEKSKKSKAPLLVLLFILLIIDVVALVIYIIGIDKVLGFIK